MDKIPIIAVVGATASGKTALAVEIAKYLETEIISFDSMQVYKQLSISTAKPSLFEMQGIKHHLIDCVDVREKFSVADFVKSASAIISEIYSKGKVPVLAGGTGLYIDSLVNGVDFSAESFDANVRNALEKRLELEGIEALYDELCKIDFESAKRIHINNQKRVLRALEIYYSTGKTMTEQNIIALKTPSVYDALYIGIGYKDRQKLYDRINKRVDLMIGNGLVDEAKAFFRIKNTGTSTQAIGCKEMLPYINGEKSLFECAEALKMQTRRYAKRQLTWFGRNTKINWIYADEFENTVEKAKALCYNFLNERGVFVEEQK